MGQIVGKDEPARTSLSGLTLTVKDTTATAGSTAYVDLYVSAKDLPENYTKLRNWQITFNGLQVRAEGSQFFFSGGQPMGFCNEASNTAMASADTGYDYGTDDEILTKGGVKTATLAFDVPASAKETIKLTISDVAVLGFEDDQHKIFSADDSVTIVSGSVTIKTVVKPFPIAYIEF